MSDPARIPPQGGSGTAPSRPPRPSRKELARDILLTCIRSGQCPERTQFEAVSESCVALADALLGKLAATKEPQ